MKSITTAFFLLIILAGCKPEGLPPYDGNNAKAYWYAHCKDKPFEIQDREECRRSNTQMKVDRS